MKENEEAKFYSPRHPERSEGSPHSEGDPSLNARDDVPLSRLRWACRRGMRELDVLFEPFLECSFAALSPEKKADFVALLECTDQELWDWFFTEKKPEDAALKSMIQTIRHATALS